MYTYLKKLLPLMEIFGTIDAVTQTIRDRKYYTSDEIRIDGTIEDGRKFKLRFELEDKQDGA